jgi:mono/diheme cytochrome c family protein
MPRWATASLIILVLVSFLPLVNIAIDRATPSPKPRISLINDMDNQPKFKPQSVNELFADGRAMRPPIEGTVARGELEEDDHFYRGIVDGRWAETFPIPVTKATMERGRERFGIYCSPCHGLSGDGKGPVAVRADSLEEGTWTPPRSLHSPTVLARPVGHIFNTISNGFNNMPEYKRQIPTEDRWAIVAYVRALQLSGSASVEDLPEDTRKLMEAR